ncbi:hypothetical protein ABIE44_001780 [Marmoricola sp. OAE513]|uniref:M15 family metallopeptidase n=1 Tax=Marmoricola sp. OAE513 TaxID=2817894 RepID=UPI001AE77405
MGTTTRWCALALVGALAVAGCGGAPAKSAAKPSSSTSTTSSGSEVAMPRPGKFDPPIQSPDILIQSGEPLSKDVLTTARSTKGVVAIEQFSMATFYAEENEITYAAVDPATFRTFTLGPTAALNEVWDRVADGEIAVRPDLQKSVVGADDYVTMGNDDDAEKVHVGAFAPLVDRSKIGAIVNERWAKKLHMPQGNALVLSTGNGSPAPVLKALRTALGNRATVTLLAPNIDPGAAQLAVLTGGSVSRAVGSFTYTANKNGSVNPDPRWVNAYIRTEQVPILGTVRCNKAMLIQLRAALTDVVRAGLAKAIHKNEYGGCYVPRFIASDPSRGLSFHTFGTAIDLNVPGNLRGVPGDINRTVVKIFKRWGFNWGGDWNYTDPMHFELARIVAVR